MKSIDLRSDTVTRPTPEMRRVMAAAEVGDDVYGEDPSVRALEERVADLLGKERALFVPSGTMSNQIALLVHTRPGDEVVIGEGAHCAWYESGAAAAWSGVQFAIAGSGGLFDAADLLKAIKPSAYYYPRTSLVTVENTHNRAGGRVFQLATSNAVAACAKSHGLSLHLDGARLWNARAKTGISEREFAAPFDTVNVCFSKGLGAPVGSALAGSDELMKRAHRFRKMLGGGMRQAGVLASAALFALEHHRERLPEDHRAARAIAEVLAATAGARVDLDSVETNIVSVRLERVPAEAAVAGARDAGVLLNATGPDSLRAVTHLDVSFEDAVLAARRLAQVIERAHAAAAGKAS
jgi:threonine aldolase